MIEPIYLSIHIRTQLTISNKKTTMVKLYGEFIPTVTYIAHKKEQIF
jgi:hypothetical protein